MTPQFTRRGLTLTLVCVGLVATVSLAAFVLHRHQEAQTRLHRDPSYRHGVTLMRDVIESQPGTSLSDQQTCRIAVSRKPEDVTPYSASRAYQGCWDEFVALNR